MLARDAAKAISIDSSVSTPSIQGATCADTQGDEKESSDCDCFDTHDDSSLSPF
jgi:hypothetical protein